MQKEHRREYGRVFVANSPMTARLLMRPTDTRLPSKEDIRARRCF